MASSHQRQPACCCMASTHVEADCSRVRGGRMAGDELLHARRNGHTDTAEEYISGRPGTAVHRTSGRPFFPCASGDPPAVEIELQGFSPPPTSSSRRSFFSFLFRPAGEGSGWLRTSSRRSFFFSFPSGRRGERLAQDVIRVGVYVASCWLGVARDRGRRAPEHVRTYTEKKKKHRAIPCRVRQDVQTLIVVTARWTRSSRTRNPLVMSGLDSAHR